MSEEKKFIGTKVDEKTWLELKRYALEKGMRLNETLALAVNELINKAKPKVLHQQNPEGILKKTVVKTKKTKKGDKK
jgi:hypothetical protein